MLTSEEVSVYSKEGFKVPNQWPLTKVYIFLIFQIEFSNLLIILIQSEEKILKLVRRKIRNKVKTTKIIMKIM